MHKVIYDSGPCPTLADLLRAIAECGHLHLDLLADDEPVSLVILQGDDGAVVSYLRQGEYKDSRP